MQNLTQKRLLLLCPFAFRLKLFKVSAHATGVHQRQSVKLLKVSREKL
jgi:hypothetical protein